MSFLHVSVDMERETGADSIPTIAEHYHAYSQDGDELDVLECVYPRCHVRRRDPEAMWVHVHFSPKHGLSFGMTIDELADMVKT